MIIDRRRIWVVLAVLGAVAVVTVAAGAGADDGRARSADWIGRALIVLMTLYTITVAGLVAWSWFADGGAPARRPRRARPTIVALLVAMAVVALFGELRSEPAVDEADRPGESTATIPNAGPESGTTDDADGGWLLGGIGLAVVALAVGALVGRRRPVAGTDVVDAPVIATDDERDDLIRHAHDAVDPRAAVLLAFAAAEAALSRDERTRRPPARSAREWAVAVRLRPLELLVGRYEVARFSQHEVTEEDRALALDALDRLT